MLTTRNALAAIVLALVALPASITAAAAASDPVIADLALEAADAVAQEGELAALTNPDVTTSAAELADVRAQLRTADLRGNAILVQLEQLGVDLTEAVEVALAPLPLTNADSPEASFSQLPPSVVYDAAVTDLRRIAETPASVNPATNRGGHDAMGLLAVAAAALIALGAAALANALRRDDHDDELALLAWSDGLTGLANRRRLDHDLAAERRSLSPASSVIMVDVDHFKQVNDDHGHQIGDMILQEVGAMLAAHVRSDDVVYRYGGEEFCLLLPGATKDNARIVADRIVRAAREIRLPDGDHITVSVGVADGSPEEIEQTLATADRALYLAKEQGRDRAEAVSVDTPDAGAASDPSDLESAAF